MNCWGLGDAARVLLASDLEEGQGDARVIGAAADGYADSIVANGAEVDAQFAAAFHNVGGAHPVGQVDEEEIRAAFVDLRVRQRGGDIAL